MNIQFIDRENIIYLVDRLENFEKDKAIKSGLRSSANIFLSGGKRRLNQRIIKGDKGNLRRSFTALVKRRKLGALAGFRRGEEGGYHAHLVDQGTKSRYAKNGAYRGVMPANRFWEDTKNQDEGKAMNKLYQGIQKAVDRINARR